MTPSRRSFIKRLGLVPLSFSLRRISVAAPMHEQETFTILFQGDSITDGNRGRNDDPNHILGHGYAFSVASELGYHFPDRGLKFVNKGVSGDKIADLLSRWKTDALDIKPDLISILAGINDILWYIDRGQDFDGVLFEKQYMELLDLTRRSLPQALLVVGEPFILPLGMVNKNQGKWKEMTATAQAIIKRVAAQFDAVFLPYQSAFTERSETPRPDYWIWDGIHPTYAGHGLMKKIWLQEVGKRCKKIV